MIDINQSSYLGSYANSADPDQTPQNAASDQNLYYFLLNLNTNKNTTKNTTNIELVHLIREINSV